MKYLLPFGTHGIRGSAQTAPFTPEHLFALAMALELLLETKALPKTILFGADTRESSPRIKTHLMAGFSQSTQILDALIIPTPSLIKTLNNNSFIGCGIMITASHNPAHDNGLKFFLQNGYELTKEDEQTLQRLFDSCFLAHEAKAHKNLSTHYPQAFEEYLAGLTQHFPPHFLKGISVGLDCAHGATITYAPQIFRHFGANVTAINTMPNGKNINKNCGSTHPASIQKLVTNKKLSYGFAFDGDGDRVIAVNAQGKIKNGDDILFLLAKNSELNSEQKAVGTIMSNSALKKELGTYNIHFYTSNVGERALLDILEKQNATIGAEPSGHVILKKHLLASDGIFAALAILDTALTTNNPLLTTFPHHPHALKNLHVSKKIPLSTPELANIIESFKQMYAEFNILVRYSGTEPLLRIYVEKETEEQAELLATELTHALTVEFFKLTHPQSVKTKKLPQEKLLQRTA